LDAEHTSLYATSPSCLAGATDTAGTREWIKANVGGGVLNVAGPRASKHPSVYDRARAFLLAALGGARG